MATLPHAVFTDGKPDGADSGPDVVGDTQENMAALRNALVMGHLEDWAVARVFDVTETDEVDTETFSKGTERLKATYTWQLSSGTRRVASILYEYSSTSGVDYDTIGTWTPTYAGAADHRITSESWT